MSINYVQFHIGDFLSGVMHMDGAEIGAYTMLIMAHYQAGEKGLPDNDERLKRITKTNTKVWNRIKNVVLEKFENKNGFWTHDRVLKEIAIIRSKAGPGRPTKEDENPVGIPSSDLQKPSSDSLLKNKPLKNKETEKTNQEPITNNQYKKNTSKEVSQKSPPLAEAVESYNRLAEAKGLAVVQKLTETRKAQLGKRLEDCGGLAGWEAALDKLGESGFCLGDNDRGWKVDFDFLITQSKFTKLMEGAYDSRKQTKGGANDELARFLERR